jgi:predicted  nucleic acid-binding Zn-ribbon protein
MLKSIFEPIQQWATTLHEDLSRLRDEMAALRSEIRELSAQIARLNNEVERLKERKADKHEEETQRWKM